MSSRSPGRQGMSGYEIRGHAKKDQKVGITMLYSMVLIAGLRTWIEWLQR